jgi:dipeptidase E
MKQIIAMGGGGFSMEPENPLLDRYILNLSEKDKPNVCFIPTASGDSQGYIDRFYHYFEKESASPSHLSLFKPHTSDLESYILKKDIIYVGGGNTKNLLVLWKEWGLDKILRIAWEKGIILAGLSAGSICWFEEGVTDSVLGELTSLPCLGFLKGSNCPHYDGESERRPSFHRLIRNGEIMEGIAADDGIALHYKDDKLYRVVSSRPYAKAYSVKQEDFEIVEETLHPVYLGEVEG